MTSKLRNTVNVFWGEMMFDSKFVQALRFLSPPCTMTEFHALLLNLSELVDTFLILIL